MTQRFRFVTDDDGHNYLIHADKHREFREWVEAGPYWNSTATRDFEDNRIDSEHFWTFTDPQED